MTNIQENIIVSSRIRIARNLEGVPFKTKTKCAFDALADSIKRKNKGFVSTRVSDLSADMTHALFEQHLISRELVDAKNNSIIVARPDNKLVIMLGEEDHIRIQSLQTGLALQNAYQSAAKIVADLEDEYELAYRDEFGYLTSCPTNLGTGMRASVMLFLPALTITGQINHIISQLSSRHLTVRGVYGEGSTANGYMYQISNQACFQMKESEIISMVESVVMQIVKLEQRTQTTLFKDKADEIIDQVQRAWGILTNAYMLPSAEAMEHLATLKLGVCLGIINFKNHRIIDDLFFITQPNTLVTQDERAQSYVTRDKIRAARVKEILTTSRI